MKLSDYTLLISSIIVVAGWFVNGFLNRRHEIAKRRIDYRLKTLHSFVPIIISMTSSKDPFKDDPSLVNKIEEAKVNFQLYGHRDEMLLFREFVSALKNENISQTITTLNKLINKVRDGIRKELKLALFALKE